MKEILSQNSSILRSLDMYMTSKTCCLFFRYWTYCLRVVFAPRVWWISVGECLCGACISNISGSVCYTTKYCNCFFSVKCTVYVSLSCHFQWVQTSADFGEIANLQLHAGLGVGNRKSLDFWDSTSLLSDTVDEQSPAPPRMMIIPLFIGF